MTDLSGALRRPAPTANIPRATYRVQLHSEFGLQDALALVPYLAALGVSHLYTSPLLRARPGSRHGYDVVGHDDLNPELGTRADLEQLAAALHAHGMGLLMDIVPNHMGVLGGDNAWWLDVLEHGSASAYAEYFDIDWHAADPALTGRVLLPILGDQYGVVLERGELQLDFDAALGAYTLGYYEHRLPIDPAAYGGLLQAALPLLPAGADAVSDELLALARDFGDLPPHTRSEPAAREARQRDQQAAKSRLVQLLQRQPALGEAIAAQLRQVNGSVGDAASFDALDALIEAQPYRLAHWRAAGDEINYRRFFDVNELAALQMQRPEVFEDTHRLILELCANGIVDGLRIDHPDGLADPAGYFAQLQRRYAEVAGLPAPAADTPPAALPLYVVVEKIVAPYEEVPAEWPVHGTTGYRYANVVNAVLTDGGAKARLERAWRAFAGDEAQDFEHLSYVGRQIVMHGPLAGELTVLANTLLRIGRADRRTRDFTLNSLRRALAEVVASFPVYRTYIIDEPSAQDLRFVDWAVSLARRRSRDADRGIFDFIQRAMLGQPLPGAPSGLEERYRAFARRLQQYTSPVAAKGIEDTALYRHQRLISVNDVGGEPEMLGFSVAAFHAASRDRAQRWPYTMLATSTHDAKRSEDVRLRIDVITELPAAWRLTVRRWSRMNRRLKRSVDGAPAPSRNDEYLLYQTLVGSFPAGDPGAEALATYADRVDAALLKSTRESKLSTSWLNPNPEYEAALSSFVQELLQPREGNLFLDDLRSNAAVFAWYGALNGISMAVLKFLSPGVPDIYQGHEGIELSLVDPDNRRPVDYATRRSWLREAGELAAREADRGEGLRALLLQAVDGRAKFHASWCALQLRREHAALLREGEYLPLAVRGARAKNVVAFARRRGRQWIVVVCGRLYASLGKAVGEAPLGADWGDTVVALPAAAKRADPWLEDAIGGRRHASASGTLSVAELLRDFPVAALAGDAGRG